MAKTSPAKKAPAKKPTKKAAAPKASAKKKASKKPSETEATIDRRRGEKRGADSSEQASAAPKLERRKKVNRRRQIDPTTCERDYSVQEVEFMNALDEYKRSSGRMFPTCSEVLEVIRGLGYVQLSPAEIAARNPAPQEDSPEDQAEQAVLEAEQLSDEIRSDNGEF